MKVEAIDLFCGIGGLTYGLQKANITVLAGLDFEGSCKDTYEKNNKCKFIEADITKYDFSEMKKMYSKDSIKVLVGCAPCQPFSSHSFKNEERESDQRWNLIDHFLRGVDELGPDIISMENVRGITKTDIFKDFVQKLKDRKYKVDWQVVYCPDYGIPQNRSRLVLLGSKLGEINVPKKTHSKKNYPTIEKILKKLPVLQRGESDKKDPLHRSMKLSNLNVERIKQSKPKGSWKDWNPDLLPNCYRKESGQSYTAVYGRMSWNNISPTITTQFFNYGSGRFGHPEQDRALSLREGALLQTFPKGYDFGKKIILNKIGRQIGNAVPPKLASHVIGKAINLNIKNYYE